MNVLPRIFAPWEVAALNDAWLILAVGVLALIHVLMRLWALKAKGTD